MKLTIKQIAEMANVSKGTVSKVLNGYKGVSPKTSERVLKLVEQLDFQPDSSARALALQKTGAIGLLIPHEPESSLAGHYWAAVLSAISREAGRSGYNLLVLTTPPEGSLPGALSSILKRTNVDGLIIGSELLDKQSLVPLITNDIKFVLLGQNPEFQHYCVDVDSAQGTRTMVEHMLRGGYRKIGALFGPSESPYVKERFASYRDSLGRAGVTWSATNFSAYEDHPGIHAQLEQMLDEHPDMDSLFISSGGEFFFDALAVLRERGLKTPEFGVGVFDDYPFLDYTEPRVTAIRQPLFDAGAACVTMLVQLIRGETPSPSLVRLSTTLIPRGSLRD